MAREKRTRSDSCQEQIHCDTYRLLNCARCHQQLRLCSNCYRGNRYCPDCSQLARQDSKRRARLRYQRSPKGAELHRLAQERYRKRKTESAVPPEEASHVQSPDLSEVMDQSIPPPEESDVDIRKEPEVWLLKQLSQTPITHTMKCDLCGEPCGRFALRRSQRRRSRFRCGCVSSTFVHRASAGCCS